MSACNFDLNNPKIVEFTTTTGDSSVETTTYSYEYKCLTCRKVTVT
jgi:hypothetical protein